MGQNCKWGKTVNGKKLQMGKNCKWGKTVNGKNCKWGQNYKWGKTVNLDPFYHIKSHVQLG